MTIPDDLVVGEPIPASWFAAIASEMNAVADHDIGLTTDLIGIGSAISENAEISVTWVSDGSSLYRVSGNVTLLRPSGSSVVEVQVSSSAFSPVWQATPTMQAGDILVVPFSFVESPSAGLVTRKVFIRTPSGVVDYVGSFLRYGQMVVERVGAT